VRGVNAEGLRRRGFDATRLGAIKQMHRLLYRQGLTLEQASRAIAQLIDEIPEAADDARRMLDFLSNARRGIVR
jgi:UDP-N-acetylglucosamine acyltransferase